MDDRSYHSFLVRLWYTAGAAGGAWQAEIEHIQSGAVAVVYSLAEALSLIQKTAAGDEERRGDNGSRVFPPAPHSRQ